MGNQGKTTGYRGDVNIINVDGDIVDGDCNKEVLSDGSQRGKVSRKGCG